MVFKAFDVKAHINVALKISKRGFEPELENELSRLETVHSANQGVFTNIIKPLDHFMTRGKLVIVYPFRPVGSLESMVRNRTSQFVFADIQSFARQMINALLCLSSAGLQPIRERCHRCRTRLSMKVAFQKCPSYPKLLKHTPS